MLGNPSQFRHQLVFGHLAIAGLAVGPLTLPGVFAMLPKTLNSIEVFQRSKTASIQSGGARERPSGLQSLLDHQTLRPSLSSRTLTPARVSRAER